MVEKERSPSPLRVALRSEQYSYENMERVGQITINFDEKIGVMVEVDGFEFTDLPTCRENLARSLAWGAAILANMAEAQRLVPGGPFQMCPVNNLDQRELDQALPHLRKLKRELSHRMFMLGETSPPINE